MLSSKLLKPFTWLIVVLLSNQLTIFAQDEIVRRSLPELPGANLEGMSSWIDDNGYVLIGLNYTSHAYSFFLFHRKKGEITSFTGRLIIKEVIGFTSTPDEFTLFFKGFYNDKADTYFISFLKTARKLPIVTPWLEAVAKDNRIIQYSAFNKLFLITKKKDQYSLVEIEKYDKVLVRSINVGIELREELAKPLQIMPPAFCDTKNRMAAVKVYPYSDSLVITSDQYVYEKSLTKLFTINFQTGKLNVRQIIFPEAPPASLIVGDRLYQLGFKQKTLILRTWEFPSLRKLNEFNYESGDSITIQSSPLMCEDGEQKDKNWEPEKIQSRTLNFLAKGSPYLEGTYQGNHAVLYLGSEHASGGYSTPMAGGGMMHVPGNVNSFYIKACIDGDTQPCREVPKNTLRDKLLVEEQKLSEANTKDLQFIETANSVYCTGIERKSKSFFVKWIGKD